MANPATRIATYADLEAVPDHLVAEILFGSLVTRPRPAPPHGTVALSLGERMPHHPRTAYVETPPDWVCELSSPSSENFDRGPKRLIHATYAVPHMCLVEPVGEVAVDAPPFAAVPFQLSAIWPLEPAPDTN